MRTLHAVGFAAVLAATALVAPGGASAAQPETYTGEFDGPIQQVGCNADTPTNAEAGGTWSVRLYGDTAKGKFTITVDGEKHLSYPFPGMAVDEQGDESFTVSGMTAAGLLTLTLSGDDFTYMVGTGEPGSYHYPGGMTCDSVTYPGHLD